MFVPPDSPFNMHDWRAAFTSQEGEYDYWITEVEGKVPEHLRGTLFRNGPGRFGTLTYERHCNERSRKQYGEVQLSRPGMPLSTCRNIYR